MHPTFEARLKELTTARDEVREHIYRLQVPDLPWNVNRHTEVAPLIAKLMATLEGLNECIAEFDEPTGG